MEFYYNENKKHKRPECRLIIANPMESIKAVEKVNAVADTGADMTIIPENVIKSLGNLTEGELVKYLDANKKEIIRKTFFVDIIIGNSKFPDVKVVAIPRANALIGRDILNQNKASFHAAENVWRLKCGGKCKLASS